MHFSLLYSPGIIAFVSDLQTAKELLTTMGAQLKQVRRTNPAYVPISWTLAISIYVQVGNTYVISVDITIYVNIDSVERCWKELAASTVPNWQIGMVVRQIIDYCFLLLLH